MLILGKAYDYFGSDAAMDAEVKTLTSALCPSGDESHCLQLQVQLFMARYR